MRADGSMIWHRNVYAAFTRDTAAQLFYKQRGCRGWLEVYKCYCHVQWPPPTEFCTAQKIYDAYWVQPSPAAWSPLAS